MTRPSCTTQLGVFDGAELALEAVSVLMGLGSAGEVVEILWLRAGPAEMNGNDEVEKKIENVPLAPGEVML